MRCQQKMTNYPQFTCTSPATFWVRWIKRDERGDRQVHSFRSCAQHLGKACREAAADADDENTGRVQVTDVQWKPKN